MNQQISLWHDAAAPGGPVWVASLDRTEPGGEPKFRETICTNENYEIVRRRADDESIRRGLPVVELEQRA